jgi:hypothetical protein
MVSVSLDKMSMVMGGVTCVAIVELQIYDINWLIDSLRPWDLSQIEFRS